MIHPVKTLQRKQFYENLDWGKSDIFLARKAGRSRSVILAWRRKLNKPLVPHSQIGRHQAILREAKKWKWSDGASALASRHGISREWVYRIAKKIGCQPGVGQ